jgi:hypothetical protein
LRPLGLPLRLLLLLRRRLLHGWHPTAAATSATSATHQHAHQRVASLPRIIHPSAAAAAAAATATATAHAHRW